MSSPDPFHRMTDTLLNVLGVSASVSRSGGAAVAVQVSVRDEIDQFGGDSRVASRVRVIGFPKHVWTPKKADVVTIAGVTRSIESIVSDDGYLVETILDA